MKGWRPRVASLLACALLAPWPRAWCADATHTLVVEDMVPAPPAEIWRLFTTAEGLESWMVPHAEIDLRVGGEMRTNYVAEEALGGPHTITNRVLSFEPERMLSLKAVGYPEGFRFPEALADAWSVVYFEPAGEDATRVRLVGLGYPDTPEGREALTHFEAGNRWTLDQLIRHVTQGGGPEAPEVTMSEEPGDSDRGQQDAAGPTR